ncbi:recombinase family protein [Actinomadura gamaensis]|uniref:Recombinase family protein n=1 Tax=Actinomadura gamaensis TaxID=1763541 RepID=A0ABV9UAF4_9ACTN
MTATVPAPLGDAAVTGARNARPLRAVIYARVSSDPRQQLRSVSQQIDESLAECERRGWTVAKIFKDNDRSASRYATKERPEYAKLIEFLRGGHADVLVTWESSRAQRDLEAYLKLRGIAEANGILWSYKGRQYDLSRTDDRFTTGLDALLDERESSVTRDRILRDKRAHAEKGLPHGRRLFGYQRHYDPQTKVFVRQEIREDQARVVREAARRIAAGESLREVVTDFNKRGLTTGNGKPWQSSGLGRMLRNPGYIGKRVHQGKVIGDACWPAILDDTTYYACVERLNAPGRAFSRDGRVKHLLTGIVTCGVCGGRMGMLVTSGRVAYVCRGTDTGKSAKCVTVRKNRLEPYIVGLVIERLSRPDAAELLADHQQADDAKAALAEAAEKRARLDEFYDAAASGDLTATALARIEKRLLPEIQAAEARANAVRVVPVLRDVIRPDIAEVWPTLPLTQQREVIRALMDITLMPTTRKGRLPFNSDRVKVIWRHDL